MLGFMFQNLRHNSVLFISGKLPCNLSVLSVKDRVYTSFNPNIFFEFWWMMVNTVIIFHNNVICAGANPNDKNIIYYSSKERKILLW